jgi:TonB family protein
LPEPLPPLAPLPQQAGPPVAAVRPPAVTPPQAAPPQAAPPNGGGAGEKENIEVVGGGGSGPGGTALSSYLALLDWKIQSNWVALASAAKVTIVRFRVLRSGQVRDIAVEQSSGDASADDAAIRAIRLSIPLPPFPNLMTEPQLTLLYRFNLQQQG